MATIGEKIAEKIDELIVARNGGVANYDRDSASEKNELAALINGSMLPSVGDLVRGADGRVGTIDSVEREISREGVRIETYRIRFDPAQGLATVLAGETAKRLK